MPRRSSGRDGPGGGGEDGQAPRPSPSNGRWASVLGGVVEDSELAVVVVVVEEIELPVTARAFVLAPLVVVAGDLREVVACPAPLPSWTTSMGREGGACGS